MKNLNIAEVELKKSVAYKKACISLELCGLHSSAHSSVSCCDPRCYAGRIVSNSYLYKLETKMPECSYIPQTSSCASEAIN